MGNSIKTMKAWKAKKVKVMKIDGSTLRFPSPMLAGEVLRSHPGYSLLDSDEVRRIGLRSRPLGPYHSLTPGHLYFLIELPRLPEARVPRRAFSGEIHVSAKDRLEGLLLSRRSLSSIPATAAATAIPRMSGPVFRSEELGSGATRIRMRLPKTQVSRLVEESRDANEAAQKIIDACMAAGAGAGIKSPHPHKTSRYVSMSGELTAYSASRLHLLDYKSRIPIL